MGAWAVVLGGVLLCGGQEPPAFEQAKRPPEPPNNLPIIPIPIGQPDPPSRALQFDLSAFAPVIRYSRRSPKGEWTETATNRPTRRRTSETVVESEVSRMTFSVTRASKSNRVMALTLTQDCYLGNVWSATLDVEASRSGSRVGVGLTWFPVEGVAVRLGLDSRRGVVLTGRFSFDEHDESFFVGVRRADLALRAIGIPGDPLSRLVTAAIWNAVWNR